MVSLATDYCGATFPNPFILPSGIAQNIPEDHLRAEAGGAGGITAKSLTPEPREGNPMPRVIQVRIDGKPLGIMNSVGLKGPGLLKGIPLLKDLIKRSRVPVIVSIFGASISDFQILAEGMTAVKPRILELNLSCPNVSSEFGEPLGMGAKTAGTVVAAVKKIVGKMPVIAKLSPNYPGIGEIARSCEAEGADGIVAINTVGPGMVIDIRKRKPVLGAKSGGVSGSIIKPVAIRCVWDVYEAVKIPIIGMGGVTTVEDAVEMMMAGATLVGVGSATYVKGMTVYSELAEGMTQYLRENKITLSELVGWAHRA
jgi:dihydroorotate dehydrogenase (NAD+) catalytic subunit